MGRVRDKSLLEREGVRPSPLKRCLIRPPPRFFNRKLGSRPLVTYSLIKPFERSSRRNQKGSLQEAREQVDHHASVRQQMASSICFQEDLSVWFTASMLQQLTDDNRFCVDWFQELFVMAQQHGHHWAFITTGWQHQSTNQHRSISIPSGEASTNWLLLCLLV